jgi:hypothetical protein
MIHVATNLKSASVNYPADAFVNECVAHTAMIQRLIILLPKLSCPIYVATSSPTAWTNCPTSAVFLN